MDAKTISLNYGWITKRFSDSHTVHNLNNCKLLIIGHEEFSHFDYIRTDDVLEFFRIINDVRKSGDSLLIIGFKFDPDFISMLLRSTGDCEENCDGRCWINVVSLPVFNDSVVSKLSEVGKLFGATVLNAGLDAFDEDTLGYCNKVKVSSSEVVLDNGVIDCIGRSIKFESSIVVKLSKSKTIWK